MKFSEALDCLENPENYDWTYDGKSVRLIVDSYSDLSDGNLYVCGFEFGPHYIIAARSFEAAWEAWVDSEPTIPEDELVEAYGPEGTPDGSFYDMALAAARKLKNERLSEHVPLADSWEDYEARKAIEDAAYADVRAHAKRMLDECENSDLIEGYEYQSNWRGTGIVSMGHYAWMNEADNARVEFSARQG